MIIGILKIFACNDVIGHVRFDFNFVPCRNSFDFYNNNIIIRHIIRYILYIIRSRDQGLRTPVSPRCPYTSSSYIISFLDRLSCVNDLSPNLERKIVLAKDYRQLFVSAHAHKCIIMLL